MREHGLCYVADCDAYIDEAMSSIASVRRCMPQIPIAMITRRELFRSGTPVTDWIELQEKDRRGPIVKTNARLAPYQRVAFLDTDTIVIADLTDAFALLDRFHFAAAPEPNAQPNYGVEAGVPTSFFEPNSGFFLFRKSPETDRLFAAWISEFDNLQSHHGIANDQPALRIALWRSDDTRFLVLGSEFNLLPHTNSSASGVIRMLHDRSGERERLAATINRHPVPRAIVPGFGPVYGFVSRLGWARQFVRLAWRFLQVMVHPGQIRQRGHPVIWWRDGID